jgi:hypothetical protein
MIGLLQRDLQRKLFGKNYLVSRESSLQIMEMGTNEPDLFVRRIPSQSRTQSLGSMSSSEAIPFETMTLEEYSTAATELAAEIGIEVLSDTQLDALYIYNVETHMLVTVVEIISPGNKERWSARYRQYRAFLLEQGVNFIELDLTRSVQRLLDNHITRQYHYYIGVYLPKQPPLVIGNQFNQPLKRVALPLRNEVIAIDTQSYYDEVYQDAAIAGHILYDNHYISSELPFPSTFTQAERAQALQRVEDWLKRLSELPLSSEG